MCGDATPRDGGPVLEGAITPWPRPRPFSRWHGSVVVASMPLLLRRTDGRTAAFSNETLVICSDSERLPLSHSRRLDIFESQSVSTRIARQSLPLAKEGRIQDVRRPRPQDPKFDYLSHTTLDEYSRGISTAVTMPIMSLSRHGYDMLR